MEKHQCQTNNYCATNSKRQIYDGVLVQYCNICGKIKDLHFFPDEKVIKKLVKKNLYFNVEGSELLKMKFVPQHILQQAEENKKCH